MGGAPGNAEAAAITPEESMMAGIMAAGIRKVASKAASHSNPLAPSRVRPVTAALVASVTWTSPCDRFHTSQVSTVPNRRSRTRPAS